MSDTFFRQWFEQTKTVSYYIILVKNKQTKALCTHLPFSFEMETFSIFFTTTHASQNICSECLFFIYAFWGEFWAVMMAVKTVSTQPFFIKQCQHIGIFLGQV